MIGHCMTAGGALELIATALALQRRRAAAHGRLHHAGPGMRRGLRAERARPADVRWAMSNAFAFGGLNAVLVARRWAA